MTPRIIIIDNYDSFTYNIVAALRSLGCEPDVARNDALTADEVIRGGYDGIIISPGPGVPADAGIVPGLLGHAAAGGLPVLGVCLGHQAIAEFSGARLVNLAKVYHGIATRASLTPEGRDDYLFNGLPDSFDVGRYHSWAVDPASIPSDLAVTAISPDGCIMAVAHCRYDLRGVQFHPESIMTPDGTSIFRNFIDHISANKASKATIPLL